MMVQRFRVQRNGVQRFRVQGLEVQRFKGYNQWILLTILIKI